MAKAIKNLFGETVYVDDEGMPIPAKVTERMPPIIEKPEKEKKYYSISEVADLFKVNTSLIRYWEKQFSELKPQKSTMVDGDIKIQIIKLLENS